jgi:hypothetical protein
MSTLRVNNMTDTGGTGSTYATGHVVQVLSTTKTDRFTTTSTSLVDVTGLSVTIAPKSANSKIFVTVNTTLSSTGVSTELFQLVRNSTAIGSGTSGTANASYVNNYSAVGTQNGNVAVSFSFLDSPATTSATTYKLQVSLNTGTLALGGRALSSDYSGISTITVMEIAQ